MASKLMRNIFSGGGNKTGSHDILIWSQQDEKLMHAVKKGNIERVSNQLKKGGNPGKIDPNQGTSAFHIAATEGKLQIINIILDSAIPLDINVRDHTGQTALHCAIQNGHTDVTKLLLEKNSDVLLTDNDQRSVLHLACDSSHIDNVKLLLEYEAPINHRDKDGKSALCYAACRGQAAICRLLLEKGADIDDCDLKGNTALIHAVLCGQAAVCAYLVNRGADLTVTDNDDHSALWHATILNQPGVRKLLEKAINQSGAIGGHETGSSAKLSKQENEYGSVDEILRRKTVATQERTSGRSSGISLYEVINDPNLGVRARTLTGTSSYSDSDSSRSQQLSSAVEPQRESQYTYDKSNEWWKKVSDDHVIGSSDSDSEELPQILDQTYTNLRDRVDNVDTASSVKVVPPARKSRSKIANQELGVDVNNMMSDRQELSDVRDCKLLLQQQTQVLDEQMRLLGSFNASCLWIRSQVAACYTTLDVLEQQPSASDGGHTETQKLRNKLGELLAITSIGAEDLDLTHDILGSENVSKLSDLLEQFENQHINLRQQNKLLELRIQTIEMRLSQTNVVVMELELAKKKNLELQHELITSQELYQGVHSHKDSLSENIAQLKLDITQYDKKYEPDVRLEKMYRVESSLRQYVEELLVSSDLKTNRELEGGAEIQQTYSDKAKQRKLELTEKALRLEVEEQLTQSSPPMLFVRHLSESPLTTSLSSSIVEVVDSSAGKAVRRSDEIVDLQMLRMTRVERALRAETEETLLMHGALQSVYNTLDSEKKLEQNDQENQQAFILEIQRLKQSLHAEFLQNQDRARVEAALREQVEESLMMETWEEVIKAEQVTSSYDEHNFEKESLEGENKRLKEAVCRSQIVSQQLACTEASLRLEVEEALLNEGKLHEQLEYSACASRLTTDEPDKLSIEAAIDDLKRSLARSRIQCLKLAHSETALRQEVEDALLLRGSPSAGVSENIDQNVLAASPSHEKVGNVSQYMDSMEKSLNKYRIQCQEMVYVETALRREVEEALLLKDELSSYMNARHEQQLPASLLGREANEQISVGELDKLKLVLNQSCKQFRGMAVRETALRREIEETIMSKNQMINNVNVKDVHASPTVREINKLGCFHEDEDLKLALAKFRLQCREMSRVETELRREVEEGLFVNYQLNCDADLQDYRSVLASNDAGREVDILNNNNKTEKLELPLIKSNAWCPQFAKVETALRNEIEESLLLKAEISNEDDGKAGVLTTHSLSQRGEYNTEMKKLSDALAKCLVQRQEVAKLETALRREIEEALLLKDEPKSKVLVDNSSKEGVHERITFEDSQKMKVALARSQLLCQEMAKMETALRREIEEALLRHNQVDSVVDVKIEHTDLTACPANQDSSNKSSSVDDMEKMKLAFARSRKQCKELTNIETALRREIEEALLLKDQLLQGDYLTRQHVLATSCPIREELKLDQFGETEILKDALTRSQLQCQSMASRETALRKEIEETLLTKKEHSEDVNMKLDYKQPAASPAFQKAHRMHDTVDIDRMKVALTRSLDNCRDLAYRETALRREIEETLLLKDQLSIEIEVKREHDVLATGPTLQDVGTFDQSGETEKLRDDLIKSQLQCQAMANRETALRREIEDALLLKDGLTRGVVVQPELNEFSLSSALRNYEKQCCTEDLDHTNFTLTRSVEQCQKLASRETSLRREIEDLLLLSDHTEIAVKLECSELSTGHLQQDHTPGNLEEMKKLKDALAIRLLQCQEMSNIEAALRKEIEETIIINAELKDKYTLTDSLDFQDLYKPSYDTDIEALTLALMRSETQCHEMANMETALRREIEEALLLHNQLDSVVDVKIEHTDLTACPANQDSSIKSSSVDDMEKMKLAFARSRKQCKELTNIETALRKEIEESLLLKDQLLQGDYLTRQHVLATSCSIREELKLDQFGETEILKDALTRSQLQCQSMASRETALRKEIEETLLTKKEHSEDVNMKLDYKQPAASPAFQKAHRMHDTVDIDRMKVALTRSLDNCRDLAYRETALRREIEETLLLKDQLSIEIEVKREHDVLATGPTLQDVGTFDQSGETEKLRDDLIKSQLQCQAMANRETALRREIEDALLLKDGLTRGVVVQPELNEFSLSSALRNYEKQCCTEDLDHTNFTLTRSVEQCQKLASRETSLRREIEDLLLLSDHTEIAVKLECSELSTGHLQQDHTPGNLEEMKKLKDALAIRLLQCQEMSNIEAALRKEIEETIIINAELKDKYTLTDSLDFQDLYKPSYDTDIEALTLALMRSETQCHEMANMETALRREIEEALLLHNQLDSVVDVKIEHTDLTACPANQDSSIKSSSVDDMEKMKLAFARSRKQCKELTNIETALRKEIEESLLLKDQLLQGDYLTRQHVLATSCSIREELKLDQFGETEILKDALTRSQLQCQSMASRETALRKEIEETLLTKKEHSEDVNMKLDYKQPAASPAFQKAHRMHDTVDIDRMKVALTRSLDNCRDLAYRETALRREIEETLLLKDQLSIEIEVKREHDVLATGPTLQDVGTFDQSGETEKLRDDLIKSQLQCQAMANRETALRREIEDALLLKDGLTRGVVVQPELNEFSLSSALRNYEKQCCTEDLDHTNFTLTRSVEQCQKLASRETSLRREIEDLLLLSDHTEIAVKLECSELSTGHLQQDHTPGNLEEMKKLKDALAIRLLQCQEMSNIEAALRKEIEETIIINAELKDKYTLTDSLDFQDLYKPSYDTDIEALTLALMRSETQCHEMANMETALRREIEEALLLHNQLDSVVDVKIEHTDLTACPANQDSSIKSSSVDDMEKMKLAFARSRKQCKELTNIETALRKEIEESLLLKDQLLQGDYLTRQHVLATSCSIREELKLDQFGETELLKDALTRSQLQCQSMASRETALRKEIEETLLTKNELSEDVNMKLDYKQPATRPATSPAFQEAHRMHDTVDMDRMKVALARSSDNCRDLAYRETALRREIEETLLFKDQLSIEIDVKHEHDVLATSPTLQDVGTFDQSRETEKLKDALIKSQLQCQAMANRETALRREIEEALLEKDELTRGAFQEADKLHDFKEIDRLKVDLTRILKKCEVSTCRETALRREIEELLLLKEQLLCNVDVNCEHNVLLSRPKLEDFDQHSHAHNQVSCKRWQDMTVVETTLRREIEELVLAQGQLTHDGIVKLEYDVLAASSSYQEVNMQAHLEENEKLKEALVRSRMQCIEMANRETALRREIEEALLRKHQRDLNLSVKPSDFCPQHGITSLNPPEIEQLKLALSRSRILCQEMTGTETALRKEIEDVLILKDTENKVVHVEPLAFINIVHGIDEQDKADEMNKLRRILNGLHSQCRDMAHVESALRNEIEDALLHEGAKLNNDAELACAQLLVFEACQSEVERYKQQLEERNEEVSVLENKLRDFAVRFDEQAAEFQLALRQMKRASISDLDNAQLLAEIEMLKTKLEQESSRKSVGQPVELETMIIESLPVSDEEKVISQGQLTSVPLKEYTEASKEVHIDRLLEENASLRHSNDDLQKEIKALRKTVAEQSLYLGNITSTHEQPKTSAENEELLVSSSNADHIYADDQMTQSALHIKNMRKMEFSLRTEIEDLLISSPTRDNKLSSFASRPLGCVDESIAHYSPDQQTMQTTERSLRFEIEERILKDSLLDSVVYSKLSTLKEKNARLSGEKLLLLKELEQLRQRFAGIREKRVGNIRLSMQVIPSVSIDPSKSSEEDSKEQVLKLTANLSEKDAQIEEQRKQYSSEIESLRKELTSSPRRLSGFEKSNDMMIAQMEIQIALLMERVKDLENMKEENENLKMENQRLKSVVEKERLKRFSRNSNSSPLDGDDISNKFSPEGSVVVSHVSDMKQSRDDIDGNFEYGDGSVFLNRDVTYRQQWSQTEDTRQENDLLLDEIAALSEELEQQKSIASNMLAPIGADDDMLIRQVAALHTRVKDLQEEKQSLSETTEAEKAQLVIEIQSLQSDLKQLSSKNIKLANEIKLKTDEAACEIEALEEENVVLKKKLHDLQNKSAIDHDNSIEEHEQLIHSFSLLHQENSHLTLQLESFQTRIGELLDCIETMKRQLMHERVGSSTTEKALRAEIKSLLVEHENCKVQMPHLEQQIEDVRKHEKLSDDTELNRLGLKLEKKEQIELTLRAKLEDSHLECEAVAEESDIRQKFTSEQDKLKQYISTVSDQQLQELNLQTERLRIENLYLKSVIDKLTNSSARSEMHLRSEIEYLLTSKEDMVPLGVKKTSGNEVFVRSENVQSLMELKFMQSVEKALREEIEDLLTQITDTSCTEKDVRTEFGRNYAQPKDLEHQIDVLDSKYPEEFDQLLERYIALENTLKKVQKDKEALENSPSQMENNEADLSAPSHDSEYVVQLQREVYLLKDVNHALANDVSQLQYRLSQQQTAIEGLVDIDVGDESEYMRRKLKQFLVEAAKHAADMAVMEEREQLMKRQMKQLQLENFSLAEENNTLRDVAQLRSIPPKELVTRLRSENAKLNEFVQMLEKRLERRVNAGMTQQLAVETTSEAAKPLNSLQIVRLLSDDVSETQMSYSQAVMASTIEECHNEIDRLRRVQQETETKYREVVATYRAHLLAMAQGRVDSEVRDALQRIVLLRDENNSESAT